MASHVATASGFGRFLELAPFHYGTPVRGIAGWLCFMYSLGEGYWIQQLCVYLLFCDAWWKVFEVVWILPHWEIICSFYAALCRRRLEELFEVCLKPRVKGTPGAVMQTSLQPWMITMCLLTSLFRPISILFVYVVEGVWRGGMWYCISWKMEWMCCWILA